MLVSPEEAERMRVIPLSGPPMETVQSLLTDWVGSVSGVGVFDGVIRFEWTDGRVASIDDDHLAERLRLAQQGAVGNERT